MSDQIKIEVACEVHAGQWLSVTTEDGGSAYDLRLCVGSCPQCIADPLNTPAKEVDVIFNDSNFTIQTVEV